VFFHAQILLAFKLRAYIPVWVYKGDGDVNQSTCSNERNSKPSYLETSFNVYRHINEDDIKVASENYDYLIEYLENIVWTVNKTLDVTNKNNHEGLQKSDRSNLEKRVLNQDYCYDDK